MGHLKHDIHIDAPYEKVWGYSHDPHNWAAFMVGMGEPDKISGDGGVGTEVEFTVQMAGWPLHVNLRVAEDDHRPDGSHWRCDITGTSPGWMSWDSKPDSGGTLVTQEFEYKVPGSVLGKVVDRLVYEKRQKQDMVHSLENLKLLMEKGSA